METTRRVPTKILSLFLSVLMACSCFTLALPSLSANAKAAATANDWQALVDAFTAAYSGGYFSTDPYAVSDDGAGHLTVADTTTNGYIYAVVRALINVAAAEKSEENDHNATIRTAIKAGLEARMSVTPAMKEFIDDVLPVPAEGDGAYHWYGDQCWQGQKTDELKPTADVTITLTVTRSVKSAVLTDYADAADVPEQVETEYKLTTTAKAYEGSSDLGDNYCTVWYQNDTMAPSAGMSAAPDLSAIVAYNALVNDAAWQADYVAYTEDELSVYQHTKDELEAIYNDYIAAENAANACDPDYVEKFIGAANMNAYRNYANFCYAGKSIPVVKKYVDWIQGLPISDNPGFEDSINKLDYDENDRDRMQALIDQAGTYKAAIDATGATTISILVSAYGYDTNSYSTYIAGLRAKIQTFDMKDILKAYNFMIENAAPATYNFPQGSQFYSDDGYVLTSDTAIDEDTTYYVLVDDAYVKVDAPVAADLGSYYEYVPHNSVTGVGNDTFYSQPYVEAGHECPLTDEDLALTYAWLSGAISAVNNTPAAVRSAVISDSVLNQMSTLKAQLNEEIIYRGFGDASEAFVTEYNYFVNLMLNTSLAGMSDVALKGRADDPETEVNEYVKGLIAEATEHYNTLNTAYNTCAAACSNASVKNRYLTFKNKAYNYIGSIYGVLFNRVYNKLTTIKADVGGGIGASNFSLVKGGVAGFDEDQETDGIQNALYSWVVANQSNVINRGGITQAQYNDMVSIFNNLAGWRETANSYGEGGWGAWGSRYYCDGNSGTYVTRNARSDDMVRYIAGDGESSQRYAYTVTNTKIETVIDKLDTFLKSDSFIKLIDKYDPAAGVTDLTGFIEQLLIENLFTNDIVNMIVSALFPMVCNLLENELKGMLQTMKINGWDVGQGAASGYDFTWNVKALLNGVNANLGDASIEKATADGAFNGTQGTSSFYSVFTGMQVNIYPRAFGDSLPASINGVSLSTFKSRLNSAYNDWNYFKAVANGGNGDDTLDKEDLAWVDWGVKDYDTAVTALGAVFNSILPLARTLFCGQPFQKYVSNLLYIRLRDGKGSYNVPVIGNSDFWVDGTTGYASGTLTIAGCQGFNNLWAPLVEGLGVQTYTSSLSPSVSNAISTTIGNSGSCTAAQLVSCLLMPVYSLIKTVSANPLSTVTKILPNISYAVSYNLIQPLLHAIDLNMNIDASLDIQNVGSIQVLYSWLGVSTVAGWFEGTIENAISNALNFDVPLELGGQLDLSDMLGVDITNLNALAGMIFGMIGSSDGTANAITIPAINSAYLGRLGDRTQKSGSPRTQNLDGSGLGAGQYYYVVADRADVLYDVIRWVLNFASQPGALVGLLSAFGLDGLPEGIDDILSSIQVGDAIAALVELFLPRGLSGSGYSTGYDMADYDWYRPGTSASHYNVGSSNFVYLKYQNDWTAAKAKYIWDNADDVATAIYEIIDEEGAADFTGFSDFFLTWVNKMFNNWGIMNVVNLLMTLGNAAESENHTIANLVKDQIKINGQNLNLDMRSWFNSFGYLYGDQRVLNEGEFVYTNKKGEFCVGVDGDTTEAGMQPDFVRSYPLAPTGFGGFNKVAGEYVPVVSGGAGKRGDVTSYYKYTMNATTKEVTYVLTNGTPDSGYTNSYPNLQVSLYENGEKDDRDNYWAWKVKGSAYTVSNGLANGTWYDLVEETDVSGNSTQARAVFTAIFCELMKPVMGIVGLILTGDDLSLFNNALTIKGYQCYDGAIIPMLEMLGVTGLKTQAQYNADYKMLGASDPNGKAQAGFYYLVNKLFDRVNYVLSYAPDPVTGEVKTPIQKLIEILPGIFYFFQSDGLSTLLKNLLMPVWVVVDTLRPIADVDLDDAIHQVLCNVLKLSYDKDAAQYASAPVVDMILNLTGLLTYVPYTAAQANKDRTKVDAIYTLTLKDLSLNTVYQIVELFTGLDLAPLTYAFEGMCAGYTDINGNAHSVHIDTASSYTAVGTRANALKKRYTLDYYGPDIITVTVSVLLDLLRYGNNAAALDELIGLTSDYFESTTLSGMTASGLLEALEVIFKEKDETQKKYPNWDYLLEQDSIHVRRPQDGYAIAWVDGSYDLLREFSDMTPYHSIYNLAYRTDWTYETALATDNMLTIILDYLTVSMFAKDNDEITSFAGFVDGLLAEYVFSGETLKTIAGLMCQLYNLIPAEVVALIDNMLGIHMTAWLGNDGYDTVLIKKDVERKTDNILSNSVMEVDVNDDGEITDDEKFDKYEIKANGTVIGADYVPAVNDKIVKTLMTVTEDGDYEPWEDEEGNKDVAYYIVGAVKTENEKTVIDWYNEADEDWHLDSSKYVPNYEWKWWADPSAADYVDTREEFIDALEQILAPSATLFSFIFLKRDYKLLYTAGDDLASTTDDTDAIILDGVGAYADAVVPLLEALGIPLTLQQYNTLKAKDPAQAAYYENDAGQYIGGTKGFAPSKYYDSTKPVAEQYDGELWLSDMMDLFIALADAIIDDPINWILNRLPGLIYFINADGITVALENLFGDVAELLDMVNSILDVEDRINLGNLAGIKLDDLTLSGIFDIIYNFTGIYVREDLRDYMNNLFVGTLSNFWSANGTLSFTMEYNTEEDRADLITILLSLLVEILEDEGRFIDPNNGYNYTHYSNPMAIDHLINDELGEDEGGIVTDVLTAIRNPEDVIYANVDWNYFDHDYNLADNTDDETHMVTTPGYAFQYLNYTTQWTYTSALNTAEGVEEMIIGILGMVDADKYGSMTSLGELINIDTIFTAELLQQILDFIAPVLYGEGAILNETLLQVIGALLGADLTQWNGKYAFEGEATGATLHDDVVDLDYEMVANYVLTTDTELDATKTYYDLVDGSYVAVAEPNADDLNTYYEYKADVKTYVINDDVTFGKGLALLLQPAEKLLGWLLFGDDYTFFTGNVDSTSDEILITLKGSHGYKEGLALLLEAFGFNGLKKESYYIENGTSEFIKDLVASVIDRLNTLIEDPVTEIVALIPELIYFINANGLAVSVQNLLAGPLTLVNQFASLVAEEGQEAVYDPSDPNKVINSLIEGVLKDALKNDEVTFRLEDINLKWVMELAEALTGMEITDVVQNSLDLFYMGKIYSYSSKSEKLAYKMTFDTAHISGGNGDFADFITILLSFLIDVATYPGNAMALVTMLNGDKVEGDDGYIDPNLIQGILDFIKNGYVINTENIDWFYFDDAFTIHTVAENTETGVHTYTYTGTPIGPDNKVTMPARTINYLSYASDWTADTADYIVTHRNEIIAAIFRMAGMGDTTVADIIKGVFDPEEDLYTGTTLNAIYDLVAPVLSELPEVLLNLANIVLDVDLSFYADPSNRFDDDATYTRQEFVNGLCDLLSPIYSILDWLLFGKNIQYFDKLYFDDHHIEVLIDLPGAEGYKYGLIPILEALGVDLPDVAADDTSETIMFVLINNTLARLEAILDNPVDEVLELLPNLLYFINTNGLAVCVNNLLAGPFALLDAINEVLPEDKAIDIGTLISNLLNGLPVTVDLTKLDLMAIVTIIEEMTTKSFYKVTADTELAEGKTYYVAEATYDAVADPSAEKLAEYYEKVGEGEEATYVLTADTEIVEGKTYYTETINYTAVEEPAVEAIGTYYELLYTAGLKIADVVTSEKIERFYLGQLEYFTSANGQAAYKMVYSENEGMKDMLTVIANLAVEILLYEGNADAIDAMINGVNSEGKPNKSTVKGIVDIILGLKTIDGVTAAEIDWDYFDEEVTVGDVTVPTSAFVYLDYCNEWTYEKAAYLDTGITALINEILALTTPEGEEPKTIDDLVAGLVDLDELLSADLLNTILDTIAPLLYGEDSFLDSYLLNVIGFALGADLTTWNYSYRFEAYDESKTYGDHETGLLYRIDDFTVGEETYEEKPIFAIRDADDFAAGLAYVLKPASRLLGWLLLGQDYGFFVDSATGSEILITVPGFNGYDSAIVLLLEALGCKNTNEGGALKAGSAYFGNEENLIKDIIDALLARVDEILADPIDEILGLIPEIIYFVNAGGLNALVQNLAGGIFKVIDYVNASGLLEEPIELSINDLVSGLINQAYADMKEIAVEDIETPFVFELETVTLQTVIDVAELFTGLKISDAISYSLATFAIGEKYAYQTVSDAYAGNTYKMRFAETGDGTDKARDRADMITIVLSLALDVLRYDGNAAALAALLADVADGKITEDVINGIINVIDGYQIDMKPMDGWFYPITDPTVDDIETITPDTTVTMVDRTINYLSYNSDWTEETAEYVIDNLDEIIAAVLNLAGMEETTVAAILENYFKISDLYTAENLNKIVDLIKGLLDNFGETLSNLVGMILADNESIYNAYAEMTFTDEQITDRTSFAAGLATVIAPIGGLLDWILFGKDLAFFYDHTFYGPDSGEDLLKLNGAEGYAYGLVPLLEALGVTGLPQVTADTKTNTILAQVIDAVLNRVETILADPEDELIAMLPNLLYFINANGISVSVHNLLACLFGLLDEVNPVIEALGIEIPIGDTTVTSIDVNDILNSLLSGYLNGYDQIDIDSLKLLDIIEIVEAVTGLEITDVVTELKITNFYLGQVTPFWSSNGRIAFKMGYTTEEDKHDMLTILLNFLVEVALYDGNADALIELLDLGDDTAAIVHAIIALITGQVPAYQYSKFNWNYADGSVDLGADVIVPKTKFIYLAYENDWTYNKAQMLDAQLVDMVDTVINMIDPSKASLSDLINGYVDLDELVFKAEYLNKLYDLVSGLLYGDDAVIPSVLAEVAGLVLGADLAEFNDLYSFEQKDDTKTYLTDDEFGLEYRVVSGKAIYAIDGKESFINGLVRILKPAERLLGWLLLGDDYGFFVDNATGNEVLLKIGGGEGYAKGLALLLEALGVEGLAPDYENASVMLRAVLTGLVNRVEAILNDPINEVLDLIPEIIYFINANGLGVVVDNLAAAAFNLLDAVIAAGLIPDVTDRKAWINGLLGDVIRGALGTDELTFDLDGIDILWVVELAEVILAKYVAPIEITDVLANSILGEQYPLQYLQIGIAKKYDSVSAFDWAYKCEYDDGVQGADRADMITILLSFAIDMLRNEQNQSSIEDLAELNAGTIADILDVLTKFAVDIEPKINWFYFDPDFTPADPLVGPTPTINYLSYASDWSEELADYLDDNLEAVITAVFDIIDKDKAEEDKLVSVANILKGVFDVNRDLYTAENLNKIAELVKNLVAGLEGGLADLIPAAVELLLDVDLHAWDDMVFEEGAICDKETFIDGLYEVLEPIFPVLDWMLFDEDYAFFNRRTAVNNVEDLLVINGYAGYANGLVPLLEALGVTLPDVSVPTAADYNTAGQLKGMLEATLTRLEQILADPVEEVLALLPNILYFINANGLASAVNNLLGVALQLVDKVNLVLADLEISIPLDDETSITEIDVNYLVNHFAGDYLKGYVVDTQHLELIEIVKIAEVFTGLDLETFVKENGIEKFFLGELTYFDSANGQPAYKMVYSDDVAKDRADMITVLFNYLIEAVMYGDNAKALDILISGADDEGEPNAKTVESILTMIGKLGMEPAVGNYHWNYFNEASDDVEPEADYDEITPPVTPFNNHLTYTTDWTQETANAVYDNLDDVITAILTIIAKGDPDKATTVAELLSGSFDLFTAENLNKIVDLTKKLYDNFDVTLINLIGAVLDCDLSDWAGLNYTDAEVYDADTFLAGLYELVKPLHGVLDWLLFGDSYNFFVEDKDTTQTLINIAGANGYITGLAQILYALGVDLPEYHDGYTCLTDIGGGKTFLKAVLEAVVDRVVEILADPVDEALALLPELLYFINANGVSTAAYNIAGGVLNAINVLFDAGIIELKVDGVAYDTIEGYLAASIGVDIRNLDLEGIITILEEKDVTKGIKINEVFTGTYTVNETDGTVSFEYDAEGGQNILEKFYCGDVTTYNYGGFYGWKMVPAAGAQGDIITMLLSIVLDVLYYEGNEQAIADLINSLWTDVEFTKDNFVALKALLRSGADFDSDFTANWAYFVRNADEWVAMTAEDQIALLNELIAGLPEMKERTKHYLEYDNNWNANTVEYLDENLNDIVDLVINMVTKGEYLDLEKLIEGKLVLYSADTVNRIVNKIAGLISRLDEVLSEELQDKLITTAGSLLGLSDNVIAAVTTPATEDEVHEGNKAEFVAALVNRFSGLNRVLDWLLFAKDYTFFTELDDGVEAMITIKGGEGYKYGLAPILAALGVDTEITAESCAEGALNEVLNKVADRIDELLYGGSEEHQTKTLDEVLALLPELIYFINTGAIPNCIRNLLQPADELLAVVNENLGDGAVLGKDSVADFFSFTFSGTEYRLYDTNPAVKGYNVIGFDFIFDLVKEKVGIDIANSTGTSANEGEELGKVGEYIKTFYFGQLESYTSYGGVQGYKMNYSEEDTRMDMLTILVTLVLDVFTSGVNREALISILGGDADAENMYNVIMSFLTGDLIEVSYQKFSWLFEEYADTGIIVSPMTEDGTIVNQDIYGPLYTRPMGEYMTKYLQLAINTYITLLGLKVNGKQVFTLDDILQEIVGSNVYKNEYLDSIYNALLNLLTGLKEDTLGEELYTHIAYVLKEATRDPDNDEDIGVDLNYWFTEYTGPDEIEEGNQEQFIAEICKMLRPAYPILRWLLTESKIAFFNKADAVDGTVPRDDNDYLVLNGAAGYKYGIIPILEALNNGDTSNITSYSQYLADVEADPDALLRDILTPILSKVDDILADPINGVLNLLPAVVYFIGSNGLDTCFKNLLGSVYTLLFNIEPLIANVEQLHDEQTGELTLYRLIGIKLDEVNLETLLRQLLDSLKESTGFSLSDLGIELVNELSMGVVEYYESYINEDEFFQDMYTMKYAEEGTDVEGNKCDTVDFVTIILRLVLTFISDPDNKDAVEAMLKDKVSGDGYTLLCSLLDNFSQMVRTPDGKDKMMYTVYYVFYSALVAGVATNNAFAEFNGNYSFLNSLFNTSDLAFMRAIGSSLTSIFHMTDDEGNEIISPIIDETGVVPQGQIPFWQKLIEFFKQIINFFKNMFK